MSDRPFGSLSGLLSGAGAAIALTLAPGARAEPEAPIPTRAMRLGEAVAYAREHQPQIAAARARIAAARADAAIPRAQWLPTVGLAAELVVGTTNNSTATPIGTGGMLDLARIGSTKVTSPGSLVPSPSTLVGVGASQEVFDFGRIAAQSAAADAAIVVEQHAESLAALDIVFLVESAYFAVQAAKAVVIASEGAYARSLAHRDLAKAGVESGLRPPIELTRAEADLLRFDVGRIRARGGLAAAQAQLAAAVGVSEPRLDAGDDPAADEAAAPPIGEVLRVAESRDPALLTAIARLDEQRARTRAIDAELRPNLWVTGTFTGRAGGALPSSGDPAFGRGFLPIVPNWDVGLVLGFRIFDGGQSARADASRAREQVRRAEVDGMRQQAIAAAQRAYVAEELARSTLPALGRAREAAVANYAQVEARFKTGLSTGVELADAEALRTEAEIQEALGRFELSRARAALGRAIGEDAWSTQDPRTK
ncbi:MAG: TolC family protein [Byssovorax sp.]